jgi:hypothetical protein
MLNTIEKDKMGAIPFSGRFRVIVLGQDTGPAFVRHHRRTLLFSFMKSFGRYHRNVTSAVRHELAAETTAASQARVR